MAARDIRPELKLYIMQAVLSYWECRICDFVRGTGFSR